MKRHCLYCGTRAVYPTRNIESFYEFLDNGGEGCCNPGTGEHQMVDDEKFGGVPMLCGNCRFLSISEADQTDKKVNHMCLKLNKRVKHYGYHPDIVSIEGCGGPYIQ